MIGAQRSAIGFHHRHAKAMPTISVFYGIVITMFYEDHNAPHIHAF